jgi:RNA polymerase sigma factor (sigma-70 family)
MYGVELETNVTDDAQNALVMLKEHGPQLHALLYRITLRQDAAEDLMQELFLRLSRTASLSKARQPLAYAITVATRLAFDWRRLHRRRREAGLLHNELADVSERPEQRLEGREDLQVVLDAVERLPPSLRVPIAMRYLENRPYDQIATLLNMPTHQVRALCYKAIVRLRKMTQAHRAREQGVDK